MSLQRFLEMGWIRGWMQDLVVFMGAFLLLYIWSGDFNPLQSQEAAAAVWKLRCGGGESVGAQGGMLHLLASSLGFQSLTVTTVFLQVWCFASASTVFWVSYRLSKSNGIEGLKMVLFLLLMVLSMRGMLQWADFGHAGLLDFALFALAFLLYSQGRIRWFWVAFSVLLVQSALALPLIFAVLVHQAVSPGFWRQIGGFLSMIPLFAGIPLAFLMVWEHLVTGDSDVLQWAIMRDPLLSAGAAWNDLHLWADPELLVPVAGLLVMLVFSGFIRRISAWRNSQLAFPLAVAGMVVLMAASGWVDSGWMLMLVKWMAWVLFIFAGASLWEAWRWGIGAVALAFLSAFFLPLDGVALTQGERAAVKLRAEEAVAFSAGVRTEEEKDQGWISLAGLPASQLGCDCHLLGPDTPADEVLSTVRIYSPDAAILPGFDVFRDSMEAFGYERSADFWAPVLDGDMPWVHWKRRKTGFIRSRPVADSAIQGEGFEHLPGLSLNRYQGSNSLQISLQDSSAQAVRFGFFASPSVWEFAEIRIAVGDSLSQTLPMRMFSGQEGMPAGIMTMTIYLPGSIRNARTLALHNPAEGAFLLINPETVGHRNR